MTGMTEYTCPLCGCQYTIIGDPVGRKKLIDGFLERHNICKNCKGNMTHLLRGVFNRN